MNYPFWEVPVIGGIWVIGIIASIHIFITHFAIGGGAFLAITEQWAYKTGDQRIYNYLKRYTLLFVILTTVAGVVTGVGIWWSISLVNPDGTHTLIQIFTLLWAWEYLFFAAEIPTIFVYYYTWDRISPRKHLALAWLYFGIAIFTLLIINGILTFMLTPGNWLLSRDWLDGYFNPTFWPSNVLRLLIMFALAGMFAMATASLIRDDPDFRTRMLRYAARWFLPVFFLGPLAGYWYFTQVPPEALENVLAGIQASGIGNFSILARAIYLSLFLSGTILIFVFVGPFLNPKGFSFQMALIFMTFGLLVTGITEWSREMLRKPYVIFDYMYANGILKTQIPELSQTGFAAAARWVPPAETISDLRLGKAMFTYQCMSCHTRKGYRGIDRLLAGRDEAGILSFLQVLRETDKEENPYYRIMPPLVGTDEELAALANYLSTLSRSGGENPGWDQTQTARVETGDTPGAP